MPNQLFNAIEQGFKQQLFSKVDEALGIGVKPKDLYGNLRQQAMNARNAEQRAALLEASGKALDAANRDAAGLITQAGPQNQTYTPRGGATSALGQGFAGVNRANAQFANQSGAIDQAEAQAAQAAKQQAFENEQTTLRNQAYADQVSAQQAALTKTDETPTSDQVYQAWIGGLKEAQAKNLSLGNEAITGSAELQALEDAGAFDPTDLFGSFREALVTDRDSGAVIGFNNTVLNRMAPERQAYLKATLKVITAKLRKESGAAISASEWRTELAKILPSSQSEFKSKQEYRGRLIQALISSSGAPSTAAFYKAAGFEEGYNANTWYNDNYAPSVPASVIQPRGQNKPGNRANVPTGQQWQHTTKSGIGWKVVGG